MKLPGKIALLFSFVVIARAQQVQDKFYSSSGKWVKTSNTNCLVWCSFPRDNESVTWTGAVKDGKANGEGKMQWFTNNVATTSYEGEVKGGLADGAASRSLRTKPTK